VVVEVVIIKLDHVEQVDQVVQEEEEVQVLLFQ